MGREEWDEGIRIPWNRGHDTLRRLKAVSTQHIIKSGLRAKPDLSQLNYYRNPLFFWAVWWGSGRWGMCMECHLFTCKSHLPFMVWLHLPSTEHWPNNAMQHNEYLNSMLTLSWWLKSKLDLTILYMYLTERHEKEWESGALLILYIGAWI